MALNKVNYVDNQTVVTAQNLNNIQDEIIENSSKYAKLWDMKYLEDGTDLNNITEIGNYCKSDSSGTTTLINCPVEEAFIMYVVNGTGSRMEGKPAGINEWKYYSQYIIPFSAYKIYRRNIHYNGDTVPMISSWEDLLTTPSYPIGSIYMSVNYSSPAAMFGGTWEQIKDRFLLGCGNIYEAGVTGGAATHTLSINEIPSHNHNSIANGRAASLYYSSGSSSVWLTSQTFSTEYADTTGYTGGNAAHNNMPPYLTVYMWKRIA